MVPNATKLCYKSIFLHFSSILSQLLLKIVHYFGFTHAHKPKFGLPFFFADSFLIFSRFFSFPFSLPFFSLYLLPFITFLSTGKVLASVLLKTWKWNIDQLGDLAYFTTNFCSQNWTRFSGIALPEFGRYSKWTHVWMDLSLLC